MKPTILNGKPLCTITKEATKVRGLIKAITEAIPPKKGYTVAYERKNCSIYYIPNSLIYEE